MTSVENGNEEDVTGEYGVGTPLPGGHWNVTVADMRSFGLLLEQGSSGTNPHLDEEYAELQIFGGLFADGNQLVGKLVRWVTDWLPPGSLVDQQGEVDIKLTNPVRPGDLVQFQGAVTALERDEDCDQTITLDIKAVVEEVKTVAVGCVRAVLPPTR